jgi:3'-phosphoadenosine 5'-phosphosulfate sulfotransferase (PAPS reductase)/FAD synthetase
MVLIKKGIQFGLGHLLKEIPTSSDIVLLRSRLLLFHIELAYAFSLGFSKLAILALYWRMFKNSKIRLPIQILSIATIIWLIFRVRLTSAISCNMH